MKVILTADVKKVGKAGEIVEVADGYGRNYLLARKLAKPATAANINQAKTNAATSARRKAQASDEARLLASQLEKVNLIIPVNVGKDGKLFGSVTAADIAEALKAINGLDVDKRKISLEQEVTGAGDYVANVKLEPGISAKLKFSITQK